MLNMEIIWKSSSPYAPPVIIVKKRDGLNHICIDDQKLNKLQFRIRSRWRQQLGSQDFSQKLTFLKAFGGKLWRKKMCFFISKRAIQISPNAF